MFKLLSLGSQFFSSGRRFASIETRDINSGHDTTIVAGDHHQHNHNHPPSVDLPALFGWVKDHSKPLLGMLCLTAVAYSTYRLDRWRQADIGVSNLPAAVEHFLPRPLLIQKIDQVIQAQTSHIRYGAIVGITGGGKTELAKSYGRYYRDSLIHPQRSFYLKNPLVYCLSQATLLNDYESLAEQLGIDVQTAKERYDKDPAGYRHYLRTQVSTALKSHPGWLFIIDDINTLDDEELSSLLPQQEGLQGTLLFTTQNTSFLTSKQRIDISTGLEPAEARQLLKNLTGLGHPFEADTLAEQLDRLPLALMVAGLYIAHQQQHHRNEGADYLSYLALHQAQLVELETHQAAIFKEHPHLREKKTQLAALRLTLATLSEPERALIHCCSLLGEQPLPTTILQAFVAQSYSNQLTASALKTQLHDLLGKLKRRGLLNRVGDSDKFWSLHHVTRSYLHHYEIAPALKSGDEHFFKTINNLLVMLSHDIYQEDRTEDLAQQKLIYFHAWSFLMALKPYLLLIGSNTANTHLLDDFLLKTAICFSIWGASSLHLGRATNAVTLLEIALPIKEQHYGSDHVDVARTLNNLATAHGDLGDPQKQKELLERALLIQEQYYGSDHVEVARTLSNLANAHGALGDPQKQKELLERALLIKEKYYGTDHVDVARTLSNLANAHGALGDPQKQKELLERALLIKEQYYGSDHVEVARILGNLANAHGALGDPQQQKELLERALLIQEPYYGADHVEVARILNNLATAHGDLGDPQKKKELLKRALLIQEPYYGSDHVEVASTLVNLANAHGALGDPQKKKELLERALLIEEKYYGSDHVEVARILGNLANAHGALGDPQQQKELLERVLLIKEQYYGSDHVEVASILYNLGRAYMELAEHTSASLKLTKALRIFKLHLPPEHNYIRLADSAINKVNELSELKSEGQPRAYRM